MSELCPGSSQGKKGALQLQCKSDSIGKMESTIISKVLNC
jgi:hypothetical protein